MTPRRHKDQEIWVRVDEPLKKWLRQQAKKDNRSLSGWIAHQLTLLKEKAKTNA